MAEVVQVQKRDGKLGTAASQRLRKSGQVPAVLYGHKQENEHLSIDRKTVELILRHHSKIVELEGAVKETALVSDLQFDPLGIEVLHIDLQRVDMNERVTVTVPIQFKGDPAGAKQGGIVIENAHEVEISCPAVAIPDSIALNVTSVNAGENRTAGDLGLPENVELVTPADTVVFHIEKPKGAKTAADADGEEGEGDE
ncbi:50S ribosomal protein L25 [Roseiconus lacunae]|uniref:Large ribosomal subunit protein bL25 n=1 Tax=Roseiconus lacunae TaxID=2605694 RepID=A0ABT7PLA7_9BACT|nr:50S ribosomal protein L25 [Roseiconus lacunae]MCD0460706.1 50S ribosomal protein L25 [Roseiconus lacunae]MDM4017059.1 50S ribosomal protein L25 [Roseiconus lacunae]WRQ51359.1 50S ribosomal protein L25 [Stieleria sp. HD01]